MDKFRSEDYIAHINKNGTLQTIKNHSISTAKMAEEFSVPSLKRACFTAGLLHDIGKYQPSFQKHIRGEKNTVEHSICGAKECWNSDNNIYNFILALCIAGHHSGIPDCGSRFDNEGCSTLFGRLNRNTEEYSFYKNDITYVSDSDEFKNIVDIIKEGCSDKKELVEKTAFFTRYIFSCLTDADSIDTRKAMGITQHYRPSADFEQCRKIIQEKLESFTNITKLQISRSELQKQAFNNITKDAEIYLMNMPTGSGKTLASMRCALERLLLGNKKRIIYVIPYNSIIDQTATTFENLFAGCADILRHQSSFLYEENDDMEEDYCQSAKLAVENWDAPIVLTTAVQFFESLHANKRRKLRKLHNIAESIVVFDEAHLMPKEYLQTCLRSISYIMRYLNSEAIFLTATMPDFENLIKKYALNDPKIVNLISEKANFQYFKSSSYVYTGQITDEEIVNLSKKYASSLIVVNSKKTAKKLFSLCSGEKYHLSTYMTANDRSRVIGMIKQRLTELYTEYVDLEQVPDSRKITVISTSLIEAGVDLDFQSAFRELKGLDNILQTGGRCNREGFRNDGKVTIFERLDGKGIRSIEQEIAVDIFKKYSDISSYEAIDEYYKRVFDIYDDLIKKKSISIDCENPFSIPFKSYADDFHIIDESRTVSIAVCSDTESNKLLENLKITGYIDARKIQKYCCSVSLWDFQILSKLGVIDDFESGIFFLTSLDYYDSETGISFESKDIFI